MPAPLEIRVLEIGETEWTPVIVPFDCSSIAVKNTDESSPVRMRTTAGDASTEDALGPCREQAFAVPFHRYRFLAGSQPLWLKGTGPVVVKFLASVALLAGTAWGQLGQSGGPVVPPPVACESSRFLAVTNRGTAQLIAAEAGKSIRVCGFVVNAGGNTTVRLVQGTGAACGSGQSHLTPAFKMTNGTNVIFGGATGQILQLAAGKALCVTTTSQQDASVLVTYTKR